MTLERIAQDVARTKQSAHANVHVGRVVGVRNAQRDGVPIGPLWDVEITNRRGIPFVAKDLRSAVPLQVGHEVFCTWQDGDFTRGGYIISQTTEPVRQAGVVEYTPTGHIPMWDGASSNWVLGTAGALAATNFPFKDVAGRLTGNLFMTSRGGFPTRDIPDAKYLKGEHGVKITARRMAWDITAVFTGHTLETIQAHEFPVDWGASTAWGPTEPRVYWFIKSQLALAEGGVNLQGVPLERFYVETLPHVSGSLISELEVTKAQAVTNVEVTGNHPHSINLTRADFVQDIGPRKIGLASVNWTLADNISRLFDFDCTGYVGQDAQLQIYIQMVYGEVDNLLIRPDTHSLGGLVFTTQELGIGSAL